MNNNENDLASSVGQVLETEARNKRAMGILLDQFASKEGQLFAHSAQMGGTDSYLASVSLEWFAGKIRFASELPLFKKGQVEDNLHIIIDEDTAENVLQRPLNWRRQAELTQYLITKPKHKFPPALVVISQKWVDNPSADEWDEDGRALKSSASFQPFDNHGRFGLLDVSSDMQIYALDGQHRLLGVKGLMELISKGFLTVKKSNGTDENRQITTSDFELYDVDNSYIQSLGGESMGIEFISAVVEGETREEARQRIRSIFVHVNKQAQKLKQGDLAQLDEDSGFNIVARKTATTHPLFAKSDVDRVNWNDKQISKRTVHFTTLIAISEMSEGLLKNIFPAWAPIDKNVPPVRPEDKSLIIGNLIMKEYFDRFIQLPSIHRMVSGTSTIPLRNFSFDEPPGEANILFRPVGQTALAKAIGVIIRDKIGTITSENIDDFDIAEVASVFDNVFNKLSSYDKQGGFSYIEKAESLWYGVFFDFNRQVMRPKGESLAIKLLKYLLIGESHEDIREENRTELAAARLIDNDKKDSDGYRNFDGSSVFESEIKLPAPI